MYQEFCVETNATARQYDWWMNPTSCVNDRPCFPIGVNAPHMPATNLSSSSVDIESRLRGIGANNFISPPREINPRLLTLPLVTFVAPAPVFIPKLHYLTEQRP